MGTQILISPSTYEQVKEIAEVRGTLDVHFKGLEEAVTVFDIAGVGGENPVRLAERAPEVFADLSPALEADFFPLEEKTVSERAIRGKILRVSETSAEAALEEEVEVLSSLKIRVAAPGGESLPEAYAKVMKTTGGAPQSGVSLTFTSLPEEFKSFLDRRRAGAGSEDPARA